MANTAQQMVSSGVKELISKLENDGVKKGQTKADEIIAEAEKKAKKMIADAKAEAEAMRKSAEADAANYKRAGEEELKMSSRNSILALRKEIEQTFSKEVSKLLFKEMSNKNLLEKVILEIVGTSRAKSKIDDAKEVELILPEKVATLDDLRKDGKALKDDPLTALAMHIKKDALKEGITFKTSDKITSGVKVYIKDTNVEIDLSDKAVAEILLEHLQPRFRAVIEGVAK